MFLPWNEIVSFFTTSVQELFETEFAQVRYGNIGMATWLAVAVGVVAVASLARLVLRQRKHARHHSGYLIDREHKKPLWVRIAHSVPKLAVAAALALMVAASVTISTVRFGRSSFPRAASS